MVISPSFREWATRTPDWLSVDLGKQMVDAGFVFLTTRQIDNGPWVPDPGWSDLVKVLGGEDALDAEYDGEGLFTVRHKESGTVVRSNGAIAALGQLWLTTHGSRNT